MWNVPDLALERDRLNSGSRSDNGRSAPDHRVTTSTIPRPPDGHVRVRAGGHRPGHARIREQPAHLIDNPRAGGAGRVANQFDVLLPILHSEARQTFDVGSRRGFRPSARP